MEFLILSFSLIFVTLYYVFLTFNIISNRNKIAEQNLYHLPPGSSGWPIVGETLDYLKTAKNGVPEKFTMDRRNKYSSDVFKTSLLGETMVFLPTPQGNKFIFANENKLVKSWWPKNFKTIFDISEKTTVSDESARMKKLLFPLLKPNSLRKYVGIMDLSTIEHTKTYWDGKEVIKVHALAKKYAFSLVCTLFLNIEDLEIIAKLEGPVGQISSGLASSPINIPGTKFNRAITSSKKIKKEIEKIVAQRRIDLLESNGSRANDIVSDLLVETYDDGEPINDSGIAKVLVGLLVGAHDTVSTTLVCIMSFLAELPEVYDKVFKGVDQPPYALSSSRSVIWWCQGLSYKRHIVTQVRQTFKNERTEELKSFLEFLKAQERAMY
ncbi:Cytochrome P450 [Morus notabilis]|uniref:Cytochrome P450 n=1 Tax=Morus notabilis TaxID=981085 RepID=W9QTN6_9ROSA|nr:Cytochrome P450 [Morus notabilis]